MVEPDTRPRYRRWDWAWKVFLDPKEVWCKWFIKHLLDESFLGYDIELGQLEALGEEKQVGVETQVVDRIIQVIVDRERRLLHFEFQSTFDRQMALRMLQYGLQRVEVQRISRDLESYVLPTAVIVCVREIPGFLGSSRTIQLNVNHNAVSLTYPVVQGWLRVPHIKDIMEAENSDELRKAIFELYREQDFAASESAEKLGQACILISKSEAFGVTEGIDERRLKMEAKYVLTGKTIGEVMDEREAIAREQGKLEGIEEGIEQGKIEGGTEAIHGLMDNLCKKFGMTEKEAVDYLKGAGFPDRLKHLQKRSKDVSSLHLGD